MNIREIRTADTAPEDFEKFKRWLLREWGTVEGLPDDNTAVDVPLPLLSYEDSALTGGLTFIKYKNPEAAGEALWINAVFVDEAYRHRKIAQSLIMQAEAICQAEGYAVIYVYTDVPGLYAKLGWKILEKDGDHYVMKRRLEDEDSY